MSNCPNNPSQAGFRRAMDLVQEEFLQRLNFYQHSWLPARALVEEALAQRFKVDLGGGLGARDGPDPSGQPGSCSAQTF